MPHYHTKMKTSVGELTLVASDKGLVAVLWGLDNPDRIFIKGSTENSKHPLLVEAAKQLDEYFSKQRKDFNLELDFIGTEFQKRVWQALLAIPFGTTRTYGQIAKQLGDPRSVRAVGMAANKNPIPIIAPCHRVIGASGDLVGFAGGLENKAFLLAHEQSDKVLTLW